MAEEVSSDDNRKPRKFDLGERTAKFGEAIIRFARSMKLDAISAPLIRQMVDAGTSVGANYCEASEAGSKKEFVYRISVCKREIRETKYWLRMIATAVPAKKAEARVLWKEAHELNLIFASIYRKGRMNA